MVEKGANGGVSRGGWDGERWNSCRQRDKRGYTTIRCGSLIPFQHSRVALPSKGWSFQKIVISGEFSKC